MRCCCTDHRPASIACPAPAAVGAASWLRRIATLFQWAVPVATLALVPKCPACVAAYVLLFSGIGLSLPAAAAVRWTMIVLSIAALIYLLCRAIRRALARVPKPMTA